MKRLVASVGIAAALVGGSAAPAFAENAPISAEITTPSVTTPAPKPSEDLKLAKTGTNAETAATLVIVITAIGAVVYIISISRKEND